MTPSRTTRAAAIAAALSAIALAPFTAHAQSTSEVEALREQIRQLDQKLRVLERNLELKEETNTAAAKKLPVVSAGAGGFGITAADKSFDIKFRALLQLDAQKFFDDGADNRDQIYLRRVRLPVTGTVGSIFEFNITPELAGGTDNSTSVGLWDAFGVAKLHPSANVRFGKFPSAVVLEPGGNRHFIESPFANVLAPNRDLGVELYGGVPGIGDFVEYRLGVVNGQPNNTANFGGGNANRVDGDFTLAGRVTVTPFAKAEGDISKLALSVGFSQGNERGTAGTNLTNGLSNISSLARQSIFSYGGTLFADGSHQRLSPAIEWYPNAPYSFSAEYIIEKQDIRVGGAGGPVREFEHTAWRVSAGYVLTGENSSKRGVEPAKPFDLKAGTWGAFEIVGRVTGLNLDSSLFDPVASGGGGINRANNVEEAFGYGLGLNWYLTRNVWAQFNIERTDFEGGGTPTAARGAQDDKELVVSSRIQFQF